MSLLMAVKTLGDLCLYFACAGAVALWFVPQHMVLMWPALLCALGVGVAAAGEKWPFFRFLGLLISLLSLLLATGRADYVLLIPVLVYTAAVILTGRFALDYGHYYDFFFRGIAALLVVLVLSLLGMDWRNVLIYGGLYVLLGFFLLRQLQLGSGNWRTRALNLVSLLGVIAAGGGLFLAARALLSLRFDLWNYIKWFFYLLYYVFAFVASLLGQINPPAGLDDGVMQTPELPLPPYYLPGGQETENNPIARLIIACLLLAAMIAGTVVLVRRMLRMLRKTRRSADRQILTEHIAAPSRRRRRPLGSNREKVRNCYRKFLGLLRDRGVEILPSHTTAEIQSLASFPEGAEAAGKLRALYLTARYDEKSEVTGQQAKEAKELLKALSRAPEG